MLRRHLDDLPDVALPTGPISLKVLVFIVFLDFLEGILASLNGGFGSALVFLDFLEGFALSHSLF